MIFFLYYVIRLDELAKEPSLDFTYNKRILGIN